MLNHNWILIRLCFNNAADKKQQENNGGNPKNGGQNGNQKGKGNQPNPDIDNGKKKRVATTKKHWHAWGREFEEQELSESKKRVTENKNRAI